MCVVHVADCYCYRCTCRLLTCTYLLLVTCYLSLVTCYLLLLLLPVTCATRVCTHTCVLHVASGYRYKSHKSSVVHKPQMIHDSGYLQSLRTCTVSLRVHMYLVHVHSIHLHTTHDTRLTFLTGTYFHKISITGVHTCTVHLTMKINKS